MTDDRPSEEPTELTDPGERVTVTPRLIVLGVLALSLGILGGLVMSAKTFID